MDQVWYNCKHDIFYIFHSSGKSLWIKSEARIAGFFTLDKIERMEPEWSFICEL